jgi:hypothetical protein
VSKRTILTQQAYDTIPKLVETGMSAVQIAQSLGVTPSTLMVQCSKRRISLRRGGPLLKRRPLHLGPVPLPLQDSTMSDLRMFARKRGIDEAKLAARLLEIIVSENLYAAVLDEAREERVAFIPNGQTRTLCLRDNYQRL